VNAAKCEVIHGRECAQVRARLFGVDAHLGRPGTDDDVGGCWQFFQALSSGASGTCSIANDPMMPGGNSEIAIGRPRFDPTVIVQGLWNSIRRNSLSSWIRRHTMDFIWMCTELLSTSVPLSPRGFLIAKRTEQMESPLLPSWRQGIDKSTRQLDYLPFSPVRLPSDFYMFGMVCGKEMISDIGSATA
jgi:hypothetical protein